MAKRKRKCLEPRRCRSVKKLDNNRMNDIKDPPLASHIETDSNSKMIQPNTKDMTERIVKASTELAIDTTKMNDYPASDASDISISELLRKVDARIAKMKAIKNQTCIPKSRPWKTLGKSEPRAINGSSECKNKDTPSVPEVQTDSIANIFKPKIRSRGRPRVRAQKRMIESEKSVLGKNPTRETGIIRVDNCMEIGSTSKKAKLKKKRICESRSIQQQSPFTLEPIEINNNPGCETQDTASVTQIQTDLITEIPQLENKLTCKAEGSAPKKLITSAPMEINNNPGSVNKDTFSATQVKTDSIPKTTKPKLKRTRKSRTKKSEVEIKPDAMKATCYRVNKTKDTPPEDENVGKLITMLEIKPIPKRSRGRPPKDRKILKKTEMNNNLASAAENFTQTDSVSDTLKAKDNQTHNLEERSEGAQRKTDLHVIDTARTIDDHVAETKNLSLKNHNLMYSIPETVKNKYPLLDTIRQPKVLLWNIAYSDKLSLKQREMLLRTNQSQKNLNLETVPDSSINRSIDKSTPHHVIIAPSECVKKNDESIKSISGTRACKNSNTKKRRGRKKKEMKIRVKVFPPKKWNKIHASKLSVRGPGMNSQSASGTDVLSSVGNEEFSIEHRCSPSTGLSSEQGSRTILWHNDFENKLRESISPPEEEIVTCSLSDTIELDVPLDLSIRSSEKSMSNKSDFSKPGNNSIGDICSGTKKHQLPDADVRDVGFGSSTFHVTNLSTSFTEIKDGVDLVVAENLSKPSEKIDTCDSRTLQEYEFKDENSNSHKFAQSAKFPMSSTASKCAKKRASANPAKAPSSEPFSLKVSIPAKHYFNKRRAICKKLETVGKKKVLAPKKAQTASHTNNELNETDHQKSKNVTHSISNQKSSEVNLVTTEPQTSKEENRDGNVGLPTPLPDMCILDDTDTDFQTASEKPVSLGPLLKPTISNVRSLPKIVIDEILPKGTITWSSLDSEPSMSHMVATKIGNDQSYSMNINEIGESHNIRKLRIHTQSTYTSIVNQNVSQSQMTTHCWNEAHASDDIANINAGSNTVEYFQESRNPPGIGSKRISENVKPDGDHQNFIVVEQTFDSTQLWKICPELESYFSNDDVVNNNNEDRSSNFKALDTVKTNCNSNTVHAEAIPNDSTNLPSDIDNVTQLTENTNNITDVFEGVVAVNINPNEMEVESSKSIATDNYESNSTKCSVITNLTTANLRNFNNISNYHGQSGLKWSSETCQYYSSHGDIERQSNNKPIPDSLIETSCGATESTLGSQKEFPPAKFEKRRRKWIEDEKNDNLRPEIREKRLKLNRNKWSINRQDFRDTMNPPKPNLAESVSSDNSDILNVESTESPEKISHEDLTENRTFKNELNIAAEESQKDCNRKPEELDEKMVNYTTTNEKENTNISTSIPETSKCNFGTDDCLLGKLCIALPENFVTEYSKSEVDRNGNLKSMSSSSSSSSESSESISNSGRSTRSNTSEKNDPVQDVRDPEPYKNECQNKEEVEEEVDDDCISLFAESMFTNIDQGTNVTNVASLSPLFDGTKDYNDKFQDMADIGAYFDKNIQECNEAYESCVQEANNVHNTSHILPNSSTNEHHDRIIPQLLKTEVNQLSFGQSLQSCKPEPSDLQATMLQEFHLSNIGNFREKLVEKREIVSSTYVADLFAWHCFIKLRRGSCSRENCNFRHGLSLSLQSLEERDPELIIEVFDYALIKGFYYFIRHIYSQVIMQMDYPNIIILFYKLVSRKLMQVYLVKCTIAAVTRVGMSIRTFLTDIAYLLDGNNDSAIDYILRAVDGTIEPGAYWDTCRALLIRTKPSNLVINRIISECIYSKDKLQIEDVYRNYVRHLTTEQELNINANLRRQFHILLVEKDLIREIEQSSQRPAIFENVNPDDRMLEMNYVTESHHKDSIEIPTILSPDDTVHCNYDNSSPFSPGHKQLSQNVTSKEPNSDVLQLLTKNQVTRSDSAAGCSHSFFKQRRDSAMLVGSRVKQQSPDSNIKTLESGGVNSSISSYKLHPIDDLPPPRSAFRDRHWKFHLDMNNLNEALKHHEYSLALKVLNEYSDVDQTIFISSCYKMLRQNVMASAHHVRNMIKLSVRMGVNNFLSETLFTFGMYTMIQLCSANAWVLAYSLFKSLQSASLTGKVAAFALISAEICLANRRPLKAFIILKQNNMFCTNRAKWNVISNPIDEHIRVMIIHLLLDVLCQKYPDWAFYIFTYLVKDQTCIYHPIDLTAYIDKLVTGILTADSHDLISDVGRLIIEKNFMLENTVFRSLVVSIFQIDIALCRQLYHYGTWLGVYSIVKLTLPLHIIIKTNWTEEEMYLVVMDFLEKLSMDIGPATDRIGPNQFAIHLVFELAPFKEQLVENNVQICNKDELKMSKELVKTVLQKRFTPPLRTIIAEKERFMKLQSRSVVNYLKSMMVQQ